MYYENASTIEVNGLKLNYVKSGSGPAVLLLHGIPLCSLTWESNIQELSKSNTVIALDMPGYGYSEKLKEGLSLSFLADVIGKFMQQLNHETFSIAACSFGCAVALTMAKTHPENVEKLVLINSVGFPSSRHSLAQISRISVMRYFADIMLRTKSVGERVFRSAARKCYARKRPSKGELKQYYDIFLHDDGVSSYLNTLVNFNEKDIEKLLPSIKQKVLIVWGAKDKLLPVENAKKFARDLPDAEVVVMAECGHNPHEDDPDAFNKVAGGFLSVDALQAV